MSLLMTALAKIVLLRLNALARQEIEVFVAPPEKPAWANRR